MIQRIVVENFTAFQKLEATFSPGINVLIGKNGAGKTHLMKLAYAIRSVNTRSDEKCGEKTERAIAKKLQGVFKPDKRIGRLCRDPGGKASITAAFGCDRGISFSIPEPLDEVVVIEGEKYTPFDAGPVYIPTKEVISLFPGFTSLYANRELSIDETYLDLCQALELPRLKKTPPRLEPLVDGLIQACQGEFILVKGRSFYYRPTSGRLLEVELAAEGFRKLGTLQRLLQNGRIAPGAGGPLFWDEPEANLNPGLMKTLVRVLLTLARSGQQIFLATHDYVLLKEFDLQITDKNSIAYHSLYRDEESGQIHIKSTGDYLAIHPNAIDDTFADLLDRDVGRAMGGLGK